MVVVPLLYVGAAGDKSCTFRKLLFSGRHYNCGERVVITNLSVIINQTLGLSGGSYEFYGGLYMKSRTLGVRKDLSQEDLGFSFSGRFHLSSSHFYLLFKLKALAGDIVLVAFVLHLISSGRVNLILNSNSLFYIAF